ncbi:MAG TPA: hypothetical protein VGI92_05285 [Gemmatimonadales bacterium]|jgi:NADH:ubiquinone oxidoreductase subunit 2 (subunit N)
MVVPREASLAVEACLALAAIAAFSGMVIGGPRSGRNAHRAVLIGGIAALVAALLTWRIDAIWFFEAFRVDRVTQSLKALICIGLIVFAIRPGTTDVRGRAVPSFFAIVCALGLVLSAGAGDLIILWIVLDIASAALVLSVATGGSAEARGAEVRRLIGAWLPMSLIMLVGIIITAAIGGATRLTDLETALPGLRENPAALTGVALIAVSILLRGARCVAVLLRD